MTNENLKRTKLTGPLTGPVPLLLVLICLFSTFVSAQTEKRKTFAGNSLLGISIGSTLNDAHLKLDPLGENDGRDTRGGGRKESWALDSTGFSAIALKTNNKGKVVWVTGFVRSGEEIPFETLGDLSKSSRSSESEAIWNIETETGAYRIVAKGQNRNANVIYLLSLEVPPIE